MAENGVSETVQRIAGHSIDPFYAHAREHINDHLRDIFLSCHGWTAPTSAAR
jgi:hypothetical protein